MGEKGGLRVGRGLSCDGEMMLVDEGRFGLDSDNTLELMEVFEERVCKGERIIMVREEGEMIKRYGSRRWGINNKELREIEGEEDV